MLLSLQGFLTLRAGESSFAFPPLFRQKDDFGKKIKKYSHKPIDRICFLQYYKPINQTGDMSDEETTAVSDHQSPLVERANVRHTMSVTEKPFVERR